MLARYVRVPVEVGEVPVLEVVLARYVRVPVEVGEVPVLEVVLARYVRVPVEVGEIPVLEVVLARYVRVPVEVGEVLVLEVVLDVSHLVVDHYEILLVDPRTLLDPEVSRQRPFLGHPSRKFNSKYEPNLSGASQLLM